ncbi:MAG: KOW domain-containing RNA-binding protein [Clostridiales bacterium]|nr:KOW domain-containing RNA-binding protein [Clostridiales bacterium]
MSIGQVVYSKRGRDKGLAFLVVRAEDGFAWLSDGKTRPLCRPKKKKSAHVQPTNNIIYDLRDKLAADGHVTDSDIKKSLAPYKTAGSTGGVKNLV